MFVHRDRVADSDMAPRRRAASAYPPYGAGLRLPSDRVEMSHRLRRLLGSMRASPRRRTGVGATTAANIVRARSGNVCRRSSRWTESCCSTSSEASSSSQLVVANEVATSGLDDDGWPSDQFEVDPQPRGDPPYEIERRIGGSALDPRIVRTRYPDGRGHISLREVEGRPRVPAEASERDAER